MDEKINVTIVGYGNIGRGAHLAIGNPDNSDMNLVGIISRRPEIVANEVRNIPVFDANDEASWRGLDADVAILCGGSAEDLPKQGPYFAQFFNTLDSYDDHPHIPPYHDKKTGKDMPGYFKDMDIPARESNHTSAISIGWDPGLFPLIKILSDSFFSGMKSYGFYGLEPRGGLSMGHTNAIKRLKGVMDAAQYTHAYPEAMKRVRSGENPDLKPGDMHWRECFVSVEEGVDKEGMKGIEKKIKKMPRYYKPYYTEVNFISQEEMDANHSDMPHDGVVIAAGTTGDGHKVLMEFKVQWESNPEATASIMVPYARAVYRANQRGDYGAKTIINLLPDSVSSSSKEELIERI